MVDFCISFKAYEIIGEGGKTVLGRTKTKSFMTNKEELEDEITPLWSM